jgi:acylphosphatase
MSKADKARVCIYVGGEVQGVGFRYYALRVAEELGLKGYVMNLHDGRVVAEAEGDREALGKFVSRMKVGPRSAHVTDHEVAWGQYTGEFRSFEVRYF